MMFVSLVIVSVYPSVLLSIYCLLSLGILSAIASLSDRLKYMSVGSLAIYNGIESVLLPCF